MKSFLAFTALSLLAGTAVAQDATKQPLKLNLPADYQPASSGTAAAAPAPSSTSAANATAAAPVGSKNGKESVAVTPARPKDPPGTYYGDTSGRMAGADVEDDGPHCDDATYNKPQVHGSVGMGVVSSNHGSGSYQGGTVNLSQAFGSCEHPTGGVSISVGGTTGRFHR